MEMWLSILTCALTGVLTHPEAAPGAGDAGTDGGRGARRLQCRRQHHARAPAQQAPGQGHMPSWDPDVAEAVVNAIRAACPGVIINLTTGVVGTDISGPVACLRRVKPEAAACNAGSLNYLKLKEDGTWAWPPMVFDNPVSQGAAVPRRDERAAHPPGVRVLRRRHRAQRRHVPEGGHVHRCARAELRDGRGQRHALRRRSAGPAAALAAAGRGVAEHADRPRRDLAGAPAHGRTRRHAAQPGWRTPSTCPAARAPAATAR
jgi:hypothetical protein